MFSPVDSPHKRLNLGCGTDIRPGWTNLDIAALPGVDVVHDINRLPLPFADDVFDEILCNDVLEHVDLIPVLKDCHRILKPGGRIRIEVPHFTSSNNFVDPTHRNRFSVKTYRFFVKGTVEGDRRGAYYFDFAFGSVASTELIFIKRPAFFWNWVVSAVVNSSYSLQCYYEATGLAYIFPAQNLRVVLVK
ncbi:MAG: methyltransferase domain-containing protein [Verrucomicrobiaceae bacterium]|nr:MAG: methyltransferase domain-containing protein [Verrucomicrobiaceae bacterium]